MSQIFNPGSPPGDVGTVHIFLPVSSVVVPSGYPVMLSSGGDIISVSSGDNG